MSPEQFNNIFQDTMMELERLMDVKGTQYAPGRNRLQNFDAAAMIEGSNIRPVYACFGMWKKQLVSLIDAIKTEQTTPHIAWNQYRCDEVINDLLVYLILTKALFYRAYGWIPKSNPLKGNP